MNKLVSRNPILRFKLGRKIVKALGGLPMVINNNGGVPAVRNTTGGVPATRPTTTSGVRVVTSQGVNTGGASPKVSVSGTGNVSPKTVRGVPAVRNTVGGVPSAVSKTTNVASKVGRGLLGRAGSLLGRVAGPIGAYLLASDIEERREEIADKLNSGEYTFSDGKLVKNEAASGASVGNAVSHVANRLAAIDKLLKTGKYTLDKNGNLVKKSANSTNNRVSNRESTPRRPLKTKEQWESLFNDAKNQLSAQQLMYLDSLGIDTSSAEKMQQGINAYNKDSGLVVDNKWGDKSSTALSKVLSSMPSNYRNEDTLWGLDNEKNIPDVVSTKPVINLGYRTSNTYEDKDFSDRLKNMGIRSNADLIDFMHRTNGENYNWNGDNWAKQFRSDVNKALGGDYSDANIRKIFNTQGNWGRGFLGGGDIRDFQTALQTNAGTWNGLYDKLLEAADLLSRTGQNGTVYSNSHVKDLFDKAKLNNYAPFTNQFTDVSNASLGIKTPGYATWGTLLNNKFSYYKQGGILPSRNIVKRFKNRKFN